MSASTDLQTHPGSAPEPHHAVREHQHPSDRQYVVIALILGVITALEVATYFWEDASTTALVLTLFPMMIAKFAIVCGYFMHLRYDNPLFRRVFVFGLVLAVGVYTAALGSMEFFT
ncbi:MAG: cytochrome C oxidase subunit IV family protein [Acidimicrobiales bacterium]